MAKTFGGGVAKTFWAVVTKPLEGGVDYTLTLLGDKKIFEGGVEK